MKKYMLGLAAVIGLAACDSGLEKVRYDEALSQPAVLDAVASGYVLTEQQSGETAITFTWRNAEINYPASVTTDLQMDLSENAFADAVVLSSTKTDSTYSISTADLNAALLKLLDDAGKAVGVTKVDFRLVSTLSSDTSPLYSNVVSTVITPY